MSTSTTDDLKAAVARLNALHDSQTAARKTAAAPQPTIADDPLLSSAGVVDSMQAALERSNPDHWPGTETREHGGAVWKMQDGSFLAVPAIPKDSASTDQSFDPASISLTPPQGAAFMAATFHTHPFRDGDRVASGTVENKANGGGSEKDWNQADASGLDSYTVSPDGIWKLTAGTPAHERAKNQQFYKMKRKQAGES